ncbi:MAG: GNAT family N-acetyltransferase [Acidobacteria bacterium]|nr:GNAT family N-acetyltransferase [Acidobacteriota bacterium]
MQVREITALEVELLHSFRLRALTESPEAFGATYEEESRLPLEEVRSRFRRTDDEFVIGAFEDGGELIGVAGFFRQKLQKLRHKGAIYGMYVAPGARGRGVGKALLSRLIERSRAVAGLEQLTLGVVTVNEAARSLYRSQGFQTYALERGAMKQGGEYYDVEHMSLWLKGDGPVASGAGLRSQS